jgi:hypothetical protein
MKEELDDERTMAQNATEREFITDRERSMYLKGFMVAMNFIHHHHPTMPNEPRPPEDKILSERFLKLHMSDDLVDRALNGLSGDGNCPPGLCDVGGGRCELCSFPFAIRPENFRNFPDA